MKPTVRIFWVTNSNDGTVSRVRGSDGKLLDTWTGANIPFAVVFALGKVFVTGFTGPGKLYEIDPSQAAGAVTLISSTLGDKPQGIAFDGCPGSGRRTLTGRCRA